MALKMTAHVKGLFNPAERRAWERKLFEGQRKAVSDGLREWARGVALPQLRTDTASGLRLKGPRVQRAWTSKVYDTRPDKMPAVLLFNRVWWLGGHVEGATIKPNRGRMLIIPTGAGARLGQRKFGKILADLHRTGNLWFVKDGNNVLVFAEANKENSRSLSHFRKGHRAANSLGKKARIKKGTDLLIGVGVPQVRLRRRLNISVSVERVLPRLAQGIEQRLTRVL